MVTKNKIAEEVLYRINGGITKTTSTVQKEDVIEALAQMINTQFKTQHFAVTLAAGETIPDGLVLATYENIPVLTYKNKQSIAELPIMPVSLPRNMGVFEIRPSVTSVQTLSKPISTVTTATITTNNTANVTSTTALSGGVISSDGGATVTVRGVCWSLFTTPTTADSHTSDGSGTGGFASNITGLMPGQVYYVRAYATNSQGTSYGNQQSFVSAISVILLTTIATPPITANKGTTNNILYICSVNNETGSAFNYLNTVATIVTGNYFSGDAATNGLKLWTNSTPDLVGSPTNVFATSLFNSPQTKIFFGLTIPITIGEVLYLIITVDINSGATTGDTFIINGAANPVVLTINGSPSQTNNQTNISGTITVGT